MKDNVWGINLNRKTSLPMNVGLFLFYPLITLIFTILNVDKIIPYELILILTSLSIPISVFMFSPIRNKLTKLTIFTLNIWYYVFLSMQIIETGSDGDPNNTVINDAGDRNILGEAEEPASSNDGASSSADIKEEEGGT